MQETHSTRVFLLHLACAESGTTGTSSGCTHKTASERSSSRTRVLHTSRCTVFMLDVCGRENSSTRDDPSVRIPLHVHVCCCCCCWSGEVLWVEAVVVLVVDVVLVEDGRFETVVLVVDVIVRGVVVVVGAWISWMRGVVRGLAGCWGSGAGGSSFLRRSGSFVGRTTSGLDFVSVMPEVAGLGVCFGMRLSRTILTGGVVCDFVQEV